jgi:hypothetical protein
MYQLHSLGSIIIPGEFSKQYDFGNHGKTVEYKNLKHCRLCILESGNYNAVLNLGQNLNSWLGTGQLNMSLRPMGPSIQNGTGGAVHWDFCFMQHIKKSPDTDPPVPFLNKRTHGIGAPLSSAIVLQGHGDRQSRKRLLGVGNELYLRFYQRDYFTHLGKMTKYSIYLDFF